MCVCVLQHAAYLIDVLVSFDEVNREFPQWGAGRVSETRGDPPLEYGHIRQHLQRATTRHTHVSSTQGSRKPFGDLPDVTNSLVNDRKHCASSHPAVPISTTRLCAKIVTKKDVTPSEN